jgi:hypothetical protein
MRSRTRLLVASVRSAEQVGDLAARSAFVRVSLFRARGGARALSLSCPRPSSFLPPSLPFSLSPVLPPSFPPFLPASLFPSPSRSLSLSLSRARAFSLSRSRARALARSPALSLYLSLCVSLSPKHAHTHMHTFTQRQRTHMDVTGDARCNLFFVIFNILIFTTTIKVNLYFCF